VSSASPPDLTLFLDILLKLEAWDIPYVIIGGFEVTMCSITGVNYDIDMIVDMYEGHIWALPDANPLPRAQRPYERLGFRMVAERSLERQGGAVVPGV
jgi:hypothetical protein